MKKSSLIIGIGLLLAACSPQRPQRVDNPDMLASNAASTLDLTSVVASDSATVLSFDVTFTPGLWIRIDRSSYIIADGDTLPLLAAEGIEPGEQFVMPESGRHTFDLTFGPVGPKVRKITFSEGDGGWTLVGIDLMDNARIEPDVPAKILRESDGEVFAEPILEVADTKINLHIIDYVPELGSQISARIIGLGGTSFEETLNLEADGSVTFTAPVYGTSQLYLGLTALSQSTSPIVIAPQKSIEVYLDPRYSTRPSAERLGRKVTARYVYDNGRYAALNAQVAATDFDFGPDLTAQAVPGLWRWTPDQYTDSVLANCEAKTAEIDNLLADVQFKEYLKAELNDRALTAILAADYAYLRSFYDEYRTFGDNWRDSVPALPGKSDYVRAAKALDISSPRMLMLPSYRYLVTDVDLIGNGIDSEQVAAVVTYFNAYEQADEEGAVSEQTLEKLRKLSSPFYAQAVEARAEVVKKQIDALTDLVNELPDVDPSELFAAIIDQYKGKVILVDLWNTWCGPCRRALAANEPFKTGELSDPDIVWVYIADTSSKPGAYVSMVPDIAGQHYLVSKEQIAAIRSQFNVDGIPYYILVDREGNAVGHPDFRDHSLLVEGIKSKL